MLDWPGPWHCGPAQHKYLAFFLLCKRKSWPLACADGWRFGTSSCWWSLSYSMGVRHGHWTLTWRGKLMSLVLDAFVGSWDTAVSNHQLLRETYSRPITNIVVQCQLRLYGHVARYPEADSPCCGISEKDNPAWRRPRGRPQNSWLRQVDVSCMESISMGKEPA